MYRNHLADFGEIAKARPHCKCAAQENWRTKVVRALEGRLRVLNFVGPATSTPFGEHDA